MDLQSLDARQRLQRVGVAPGALVGLARASWRGLPELAAPSQKPDARNSRCDCESRDLKLLPPRTLATNLMCTLVFSSAEHAMMTNIGLAVFLACSRVSCPGLRFGVL